MTPTDAKQALLPVTRHPTQFKGNCPTCGHRQSHSLAGDVGMRIADLEEALKPFDRQARSIGLRPDQDRYSFAGTGLSNGDLRRASIVLAAALTPSPCPGDVGMAIEEAAARIKAVWFDYSQPIGMALFRKMAEAALDVPNCEHCDGTGDVHSIDGEWRGRCHCRTALTPSALSGDAGEAPDCDDCELPETVCACEDAAAYDDASHQGAE